MHVSKKKYIDLKVYCSSIVKHQWKPNQLKESHGLSYLHVAIPATVARPVIVSVVPRPPAYRHSARPGWIQVRGFRLDACTDKLVVLSLVDGELEFPQNVIVDMSRIAALLKQHSRILEPHCIVLFEDEVGAHGEHDGEGIRIRFDVDLRVEPLKDTEGHIECLLTVFFMLGECACLQNSKGKDGLDLPPVVPK